MGGVFAFYGEKECYRFLRTGLFHLQHRGQEYCGIATSNKKRIFWRKKPNEGLVKSNFSLKDERKEFKGKMGIGHVSLQEPQPLLVESSKLGNFAFAFSGRLINQKELEKEYEIFSSERPATRILANIVRKSDSFAQGISQITEKVKGGWSIVILAPKKGIYVAKDPYGFRPLVLGRIIDGVAVASESVALKEIGMDIERDVKQGEIILLEKNGFQVIEQLDSPREAFCSFEFSYTADISSELKGIPIKKARENMGRALARNDEIEADIVAGVPMSGIGAALGYAQESGIPYNLVFAYNRYSERSFIQSEQRNREIIAKEKLRVIDATVKGNRIVLLDDSIVRGTQIRRLIFRLLKRGAKEVHVRIASPKIVAPCPYTVSTRTGELIGTCHSEEEIGKMIGAKTLKYNTIDDFVKAIGLPENKLCLACFTGEYPTEEYKAH